MFGEIRQDVILVIQRPLHLWNFLTGERHKVDMSANFLIFLIRNFRFKKGVCCEEGSGLCYLLYQNMIGLVSLWYFIIFYSVMPC